MSDATHLSRESAWRRLFSQHGRLIVIAVPMVWLLIFFLAPFFVVFKLSFSEAAIARPPYLPLMSWEDGRLLVTLNFENYRYLLEDGLYFYAFASSVRIAAVSTLLALLIGYPMALFIARSGPRMRMILLMLVILPFWTSFLLRVYAWIGILRRTGVINNVLQSLGLIDQPLVMLQTEFAVYLGIVYTYLPLMILPLYANLTRHDRTLLEAASDLGARPLTTFLTVTLPLSLPGIVAGCMLVFIPAIGEFIIPELLGGPNTLMIGKVLWGEFFSNRDWPVASAVAIVLLVIVVLPVMHLRRARASEAGCRPVRRSLVLLVLTLFGFVFLYAPILSLVIYSFNESRLVTVWAGFSTKWYGELLRDPQILGAAWISLKVAFTSATISLVLGTMTALVLSRYGRFGCGGCSTAWFPRRW